MLWTDKEAWMCDLAETYGIYDYKSLPLQMVAIFSCGLRDDSRIKLKMSNQDISLDTSLRAMMLDKLNLLVWMQTKDGGKGHNRPKSIYESLSGNEEKRKEKSKIKDIQTFASAEEFDKVLAEIRGQSI